MVDPVIVGPIISGSLAVVAAAVGGTLAFFAGRSRAEHEIRFSQLYQRKADAIAELYGLLYDIEQSITRLTSVVEFAGDRTKMEQLREAGERLDELRRSYHRTSVWLDDDVAQKVDAFLQQIWEICNEFSYIGRAMVLSGFGEDRRQGREEGWYDAYKETFGADTPSRGWLKLDQRVRDEVPELRRDLRAAFREILGATSPPSAEGASGGR